MPLDSTGPAATRTRIDYRVELTYEVASPTDFVFNIAAAQTPQQHVSHETVALDPDVPWSTETEPVYGNRLLRTHSEPGTFRVHYAGSVEIAPRLADPRSVVAGPIADLPASVLHFLWPSRYCQTDQVQAMAWREFGHLPAGYEQAHAVTQWVNAHTRFQVGTSGVSTSCLETLQSGVGVCRDFAHLTIAMLRALNYPTRFVTGVDYGADPALGPPDFHAYAEAYIGDRWYLFDATGISPLTGSDSHRDGTRCSGRFVRDDVRQRALRHADRLVHRDRRSFARTDLAGGNPARGVNCRDLKRAFRRDDA